MAANNNIDDYANARIGTFFPGYPSSLTGQCVSLIKWFLAEMTTVGNPQGARGNAKDFGDVLVREGNAYEVAASQRKRGDIVIWQQDGGGYGHIGVLCSGDNVFEENVGLPGSKTAVYGGNVVYSSRLDPLYANWRRGSPRFYRVRTYVENIQAAAPQGVQVAIIQNADNWYARCDKTHQMIRGRSLGRDVFGSFVGKDFLTFVEICEDDPEANTVQHWQDVGKTAVNDKWDQQIYALQDQLKGKVSTADLTAAQKTAADLQAQLTQAQTDAQAKVLKMKSLDDKIASYEQQKQADEATGNSFIRFIGGLFNKK